VSLHKLLSEDFPGCPDLRDWCTNSQQFSQPYLPGNPQLSGNFACTYLKADQATAAEEDIDFMRNEDLCRQEILPADQIYVSMSCKSA